MIITKKPSTRITTKVPRRGSYNLDHTTKESNDNNEKKQGLTSSYLYFKKEKEANDNNEKKQESN
jgi:hypothetical protein